MANAMKKARAGIKASEILLRQSRMQGYKQTNNVIDAVYGNLGTSLNGLGRQLTGAQSRQLSALKQLAQRTNKANTRQANRVMSTVANRYGSAIGGGTDFSGVQAQGKAGKTILSGEVKAGKTVGRGNTAAQSIAESGAAQAQAGAKYAASEALAYRAKNDAQLIAQQRFDLQKMRLQNQLDLQNYRKKLQMQQQGDSSLHGASQLTQSATDQAIWFRQYFGSHEGATASQAFVEYMQAFPDTQNPDGSYTAQGTMAQRIATAEYGLQGSDVTRAQEVDQITNALQGLYPHFNKVQDTISQTIRAGISNYWDNPDNFTNADDVAKVLGLNTVRDNPRSSTQLTTSGAPLVSPAQAAQDASARGYTGRSKAGYITGHSVDVSANDPTGLSVSGDPLMTYAEASAAADALGLTGRAKAAYITGHTTPA